jgi:hypothetical protein
MRRIKEMVRKAWPLFLGLTVAMLTGCSASKPTATSNQNGTTAEQLSVQTTLAAAPEVASDGIFDAGTPVTYSKSPSASPMSGVDGQGDPETDPPAPPSTDRYWWRSIRDVIRSFDFEFSAFDSDGRPRLAHVVVHKHFTGTLNIAWGEVVPSSTGADSLVPHLVVKPLQDHWVRHLWLTRVAAAQNNGREWMLVAASGVNVTSEIDDGGAQPQILSVRMQAGSQDSTFSDPAAAITWRKLWCVPLDAPVTVTVTTAAPDDAVFLYYRDGRSMLTANGDGTYSGTWTTSTFLGLKHFGVNALSHGTLFDEAAGYHSHAWLFPYLNRGEAYAGIAG